MTTDNGEATGDEAAAATEAEENKTIMGGADDEPAAKETDDGDDKTVMGAGDGDGTTKTEEEAAAEKAAAEAKVNGGAPETYADFTLPEGMNNDGETTGAFKDLAKDFDLSQEKAQKLVDFFVEGISEVVTQKDQSVKDQIKAQSAEWLKDAKADDGEGGVGGAEFQTHVTTGMRALNAYGSDELTEVINKTKIGNNKAFIRFLRDVGADVSEDKIVHGHRNEPDAKSRGQTMYPTMNQ